METNLQLEEVLNAVSAINNAQSLNKKRAVIIANSASYLFTRVVLYLSGVIVSGMTRVRIESPVFYRYCPLEINSLAELIDYYDSRTKSPDEDKVIFVPSEKDIVITQHFIKKLKRQNRELYKQIICKEISCGCSAETVKQILEVQNESTHQ